MGSSAPSQQPAPPKPSAPTWTTMPSLLSSTGAGGKGKALSPWSGGINDDPLLGPMTMSAPKKSTPQQPLAAPKPQPRMRTLEEIEAEMRGAAKPATPPAASTPAAAPPASKPLTLEEVEAEMLRKANERAAAAAKPPAPVATPPTRTTDSPARPTPEAPKPEAPQEQVIDPLARLQAAQQAQMQHLQQLGLPPSLGLPPPPPPAHPAHPAHPLHKDFMLLQEQQHKLILTIQQAQAGTIAPQFRPNPMQLQQMHLSIQQLEQAKRNLLATAMSQAQAQGAVSGPNAMAMLMAQASLPGGVAGAADARIHQHEQMEAARRRKGAKIAEMSRYNGLMSQGDKDFITRIQVSQLVNPSSGAADYEPFADDFYFHVYSAIRASRQAAQQAAAEQQAAQTLVPGQKIMVLGSMQAGAGGTATKGGKVEKPRLTRRENAMARMAQNLQKMVDQAKERPKMTQRTHPSCLCDSSPR